MFIRSTIFLPTFLMKSARVMGRWEPIALIIVMFLSEIPEEFNFSTITSQIFPHFVGLEMSSTTIATVCLFLARVIRSGDPIGLSNAF